ncbi:MAG: 1-deoxy-D-xylulose-5-phosphate synthase [Treponema sp.]|nr:1-deoxy-D-xylulose-5-phosphate synthase [Treponema sp.]
MLQNIKSPNDIKNLTYPQLAKLAKEIRSCIIETVGKNGGHLSSNLGVVELTLALHRVFDSPKDAIIWDVSHQCYPHKLLTGRYEKFNTLRQKDGISGFTKHSESQHDFFDAGHSSTSISSALGLLTGRKLLQKEGKVIAIIGDGALTGGMAFEALSHAGQIAKNLIVILNDNQLSIGQNTGSLSRYLSRLTMTSTYQNFRYKIDRFIDKIPFFNKSLAKFVFRFKRGLKGILLTNNLFVDLGFEYVGPLNGHNTEDLEKVLKRVKKIERPVVVHVLTRKGKGYSPAENDPVTFHGIGPFCTSDGTVEKFDTLSFTEVFAKTMCNLGEKKQNLVAITAAMAKGTGLATFAHRFPERFFDVGIAEQHAVTFAGGLATAGMKPVVAIYSTFMQRGIDQLIQDIALQKVSAIFALDRAGAVSNDGETHQGIFDISLLRPVPNMTLLAPASEKELVLALEWAVEQNLSVVIRYPKASCPKEEDVFATPLEIGRGVLITLNQKYNEQKSSDASKNAQTLFICTGGIFPEVKKATEILNDNGIASDIYNLRFLKPLDKNYFLEIVKNYKYIVFAEDGIRIGGIGTYLESLLQRTYKDKKTAVCGFHDSFISQGKRADILEEVHLSPMHLAKKAALLQGVTLKN